MKKRSEQATAYIKDAKPGSLASKAALVSRYNNSTECTKIERNRKRQKESEEKSRSV